MVLISDKYRKKKKNHQNKDTKVDLGDLNMWGNIALIFSFFFNIFLFYS